MMFAKMVLLSIKRRKKEIGFVSIVTFIAVLFLAGVSLFQNVMNRYVIENNYKNYGEWIFSSLDKELSHPYFASTGSCDTGGVVLNEKGEVIGESIGSIDEGFLGLANLTFYEGRLPEKDDEIIMNLTTLAKLGYSLDLGQTIHIKVELVREITEGEEVLYETKYYEKDFTLVGTIRDFSTTWRYKEGHPLPSCVMTKTAVEELGGALYTTYFHQLNRIYEDIDKEEMKNKYAEEEGTAYNEYAYGRVVWGSQEMFEDMKDIIQLVAVLMLCYLMMSYVGKRRSWYYKLRSTGAARHQIWAMIFIEGLYGTLPWALLGFVVPYAVGGVACSIVSEKLDLPSIFVVDMAEMLGQVWTVLGIILLVLFVACLGTSDKRLSNNAAEVTSLQLWRLKLAARGKSNVAKGFLKRQNMRNPLQRFAMTICAVVVSTVLVTCLSVLIEKYDYYDLIANNRSDFEAWKYETIPGETFIHIETDWSGKKTEVEWCSYPDGRVLYRYDNGVNAQLDKELNVIEGIASRENLMNDSFSVLDWPEKRQSQPFLYRYEENKKKEYISDEERWRETEDDMIVLFDVNMDTYEDLKKRYPLIFKRAQIDEDAFIKGEQIILICSENEIWAMDEEGNPTKGDVIKDDTLKDGMQVTWQNKPMNVELPVEICMIEVTPEELAEMHLPTEYYLILASIGVAERALEGSGAEVEYNALEIYLEPNTAFGSTSKRLAAALVAHGFEYELEWEFKERTRTEFVNALCVYGTVFCMVAITYLILQMNMQQMKHHNRSKQYLQMKRLGMSNRFFIWLNVKQALKESVWLLPGIVVGYALGIVMGNPIEFEPIKNGHYWLESSITGEYTNNIYLILAEYMIERCTMRNIAIVGGSILAIILLIILITTYTATKAVGKEEKVA